MSSKYDKNGLGYCTPDKQKRRLTPKGRAALSAYGLAVWTRQRERYQNPTRQSTRVATLLLAKPDVKRQTAERGEEIQRPQYGRIRRSQLDYLLLEVFGARYLPDEVARRIALRGELARGFADAFGRHPDLGSPETSPLEALSAVG